MSMYCGLLQDSCYLNVSTVGKRWQYLQYIGTQTEAYVDLLEAILQIYLPIAPHYAVHHLLVLVQCQPVTDVSHNSL